LKKVKKHIIGWSGGILLLLLIAGIVVSVLFVRNRDIIRDLAVSQIEKQIKSEVSIGSVRSSFWNTFPSISVCLSDVVIRDSLWNEHHHDFLKAENIYISFHLMSLLKGKPEIQKVFVDEAILHLYTDACGNRNLNRKEDVAVTKGEGSIPVFTFRRTRLIIENEALNSFHDFDFVRLHCQTEKKDSHHILHLDMKSVVHGIGFNLEEGSYLKEKTLEGQISFAIFPKDKIIIDKVSIKIQRHPFTLRGAIYLHTDTMSYDLHIATSSILYKDASGILTQSIQEKLKIIGILQPFDVEASVAGKMARKVVPAITTHFAIKDATMETPLGQFTHCTYTGSFNNQLDAASKPGDANSRFTFNQMKVEWSNLTLTSSQLEIINLLNPLLKCDLQSTFNLSDLNDLGASSTIKFGNGTGQLDVAFMGPITEHDTKLPEITGTLSMAEAEIHYLPRNLVFKNCKATLDFGKEDLLISKVSATAGSTVLNMHGQVTNFLGMLNLNPERLVIEWTVSTPSLALGDFIAFVSQSSNALPEKAKKKNKIVNTASNLDRMMRSATVHLNVTAKQLLYKKFMAIDVAANLQLVGNKVLMKKVNLSHANGKLTLKGSLSNGRDSNSLDITSTLKNVDIPGIFKAFDNFGQDAITFQNMRGKLSGKIAIQGVLTDKALVKENSMKGNVDFSIRQGELNNFEPIMKITTTALKNRDFSQIRFTELTNHIKIVGSAIYIPRMEIRSNVVVLFVEGVYDTKKGTDVSIQIPVSNLSKSENKMMENTGKAGVNVRLRAKTGENGNLKVSWDPLNNAGKARNSELQKDSILMPEKN
jgi:hypothetical protein